MDPSVQREFQINTRSPPPLIFFFRRGPRKLSGGSRNHGWGSAACSTFFTVLRRRGSLWQVSAFLQTQTSETGRISPWRGSVQKWGSWAPSPLVRALRLLPTGALRRVCTKKRDHFKETRCTPVSAQNETPSPSPRQSVWESPAVCCTDTTQRGIIIRLRLAFGALPAVPSAPHPHAVQTVGATAGLEANKAKRNGAPVPCSAAAGCGRQHAKRGADHWRATDRILMLIVTARHKAHMKPLCLVCISCMCSNTSKSICISSRLLDLYKSIFHFNKGSLLFNKERCAKGTRLFITTNMLLKVAHINKILFLVLWIFVVLCTWIISIICIKKQRNEAMGK